jgi:hypothetical protein
MTIEMRCKMFAEVTKKQTIYRQGWVCGQPEKIRMAINVPK